MTAVAFHSDRLQMLHHVIMCFMASSSSETMSPSETVRSGIQLSVSIGVAMRVFGDVCQLTATNGVH